MVHILALGADMKTYEGGRVDCKQGLIVYMYSVREANYYYQQVHESRWRQRLHPKLGFKKHGNGPHPPICFLFKCVS
jgi:hypothetical protein